MDAISSTYLRAAASFSLEEASWPALQRHSRMEAWYMLWGADGQGLSLVKGSVEHGCRPKQKRAKQSEWRITNTGGRLGMV